MHCPAWSGDAGVPAGRDSLLQADLAAPARSLRGHACYTRGRGKRPRPVTTNAVNGDNILLITLVTSYLSAPINLYITQGRTVRLGGATAAPVMVDAASPPPGVDLALCTPDPSNNRCCVDIVSHTL